MEVREASASYLRTTGFKQTEVGVIPEDWNETPLGSLLSFKNGLNKSKKFFGYGTPIVNYMDVYKHAGLLASDIHGLVDVTRQELDAFGVRRGDIFFTRTSETVEEVGIASVLLEHIPDTVFSGFVLRARPKKDTLSDAFKKYCFSSSIVRNQIVSKSTYTTRALTNGRVLSAVVLPLPPTKAEQEAIAEALSDADALIESLEQLLSKKRHLKQGAMQELLTGRRRLLGFSGEWEVKLLGETAILKARIGWQGLTTAEYMDSGDYYLVTGTEFKNGYIDWNSCHYVDESRYKQDKYIQLKKHDVLVTKDGTIGKIALITDLPRPATLNSGVFVIRPIEGAFHPEFFYYLLCSTVFTEFLTQLSAGSTINHLYQKDFVSFIYETPATIKEQTAIATILSDMDAELATLEAKLAKARSLKQGMMQELLTGRIRLVHPTSTVIPSQGKKEPAHSGTKSHNWQINEAVVISILAKNFGSEQWPLGRKRYTKLSYLLHRYVEKQAEGYLKMAAGPYNPATKYKGPEGIAVKNRYIRLHTSGKLSGFVAAERIGEAEGYFSKWYGENLLNWLEQFRYKSNDELETLATVDMAMEDLRRDGKTVDLGNVKQVIQGHPEWEAKLDRVAFSDKSIGLAIEFCRRVFAAEASD